MKNTADRSFARWTVFRAWFPVLLFALFWVNSYLNYHFGLFIRNPLRLQTHLFIGASMLAFLGGYGFGLGRPRRLLLRGPQQVWVANSGVFRSLKWLTLLTLLGACGLIVDIFVSGAGSIARTLQETENVREMFAGKTTPITTISMAFYSLAFVTYAAYYLACATHFPLPRFCHVAIYATYACLCLQSFLTANRGNFFAVITYLLFMLFYVQGESVRAVLFDARYRKWRLGLIAFTVLSLAYFIFISYHRTSEGGRTSAAYRYRPDDRYGLYSRDMDEENVTALLLTYGYMTEGYPYIDYFITKAPAFAFRPRALFGTRTLRQFNRIVPWELKRPEALNIGDSWRMKGGLSLYGWPSIWGWNLAMFGYIGGVVFMLLYGWWLGFCSGTFLRYANVGALIVCFCNYSILMNSYNALGGDVYHQFSLIAGYAIMYKVMVKQKGLRQS